MRTKVTLACASMLAICAAAASRAQESTPSQDTGLVGQILAIGSDELSYDLRVQKLGTIKVQHESMLVVKSYDAVLLSSLDEGAKLHVLGTKQEAQHNLGPQIVRIMAIATGEFTPPLSLPEEVAKQKGIKWLTGKLKKEGKQLLLDNYELQVGVDRMVIVAKAGARSEIEAKKSMVFVHGILGPKAEKSFYAKELIVLSKTLIEKVSEKDYPNFLELGKRTMIPKSK
ncbi:MAG: hypothetical protein ACKVX7_20255 [Planctomycetota bacterium]